MPFGIRENVSQASCGPHPGGMIENSPAFQRRDSIVSYINPEGTAEWEYLWHEFRRPFGTQLFLPLNPALKRWAILRMSLRDKAFGASREFAKGINPNLHFSSIVVGLALTPPSLPLSTA